MANFVGKLGPAATAGEKRIRGLLSRVFSSNQEVFCYVEPPIESDRPDFVVLGPDIGVIVFEVKDYLESRVQVGSTGDWLLDKDGIETAVKNPFDQIYQYWRTMDARLMNIAIMRVVVLVNITRGGKLGQEIRSWDLPHVVTVFKEDVTNYRVFEKALGQVLPGGIHYELPAFNLIRGNLVPTCRLPTMRQTTLLDDYILEPDKLRLLDQEQEKLAHDLGEGHRLFFGVAGSGKTVVLVARVKYLARMHDNWRILVLCYNKLLGKMLYQLINPQAFKADITVSHFHKWAKDLITGAGNPYRLEHAEAQEGHARDLNAFFSSVVPDLLDRVVSDTSIRKYDAVLIDEAQDFEASWFRPIVKIINPKTNSLLVTCDGMQGIYKRNKFHWIDVGIIATGRTRKLRRSYRCPSRIGTVATKMLPAELLDRVGKEDEFLSVEEYARPGGSIQLEIVSGEQEAYSKLVDRLMIARDKNQTAIIILKQNPRKIGDNHPLVAALKHAGLHDNNEASEIQQLLNGWIIGTPQAVKGLEADVVLIPQLDQFKDDGDRQLLYVGLTRALQEAYLFAWGLTPLVQMLQGAIAETV